MGCPDIQASCLTCVPRLQVKIASSTEPYKWVLEDAGDGYYAITNADKSRSIKMSKETETVKLEKRNSNDEPEFLWKFQIA